MRFFIGSVCLLVFSCASADSVSRYLKKPLILGASVSADYNTTSPGKRLARRNTNRWNIRTIAFPGAPGTEILSKVEDRDFDYRTIIIAIDLFFWDSVKENCQAGMMAIQSFLTRAKAAKVPVLLGNIPAPLPGQQGCRTQLNEIIAELCRGPGCKVLDLDTIYTQIESRGYLEVSGVKYTRGELLPDGLHLSEVASEYLATRIEKLLQEG